MSRTLFPSKRSRQSARRLQRKDKLLNKLQLRQESVQRRLPQPQLLQRLQSLLSRKQHLPRQPNPKNNPLRLLPNNHLYKHKLQLSKAHQSLHQLPLHLRMQSNQPALPLLKLLQPLLQPKLLNLQSQSLLEARPLQLTCLELPLSQLEEQRSPKLILSHLQICLQSVDCRLSVVVANHLALVGCMDVLVRLTTTRTF